MSDERIVIFKEREKSDEDVDIKDREDFQLARQ
jgi:hypothetical protein